MRLATFVLAAALAATGMVCAKTPAHYNIPLWGKGQVPLAVGDGPLDQPFLTVFRPSPEKANGSAVIIAPGGSNIMLMYSLEGMEVAERLNDWGVTAFVLTYRLNPTYKADARTLDGQRAVRMVRSRAAEFKIDPKKIGFVGFSAGSEIARFTAAASGPGDPKSADPAERVSSRPDHLGLIYSAGLPSAGEQLKSFPPVFLAVAQYDRSPARASAKLFADLTQAGAVAELHIYQKGRHGFGAGDGDPEAATWMDALKNFLVLGGLL